MFEESLVSIWASLNSWLTPTVLFLLLNLMIGTIVFASTQNHHTQPDPHHHQGLMRSASLLQRLKSINFYSYKSQEFDTHLANPHELEDSTKLVRSPSVLQRLQSIKFNFHFPQHDQSPQSDNVHEEHKTDEIELDEVVDQFESRDQQQTLDEVYRKLQERHVSRTSSDTKPVSGEVVKKLAKKMRKSASAKSAFGHFEAEEVTVEKRRPATVKEKMVSEVEHHEDEEVDAKADDFINRFKQQLKLQRIDSIIRWSVTVFAFGRTFHLSQHFTIYQNAPILSPPASPPLPIAAATYSSSSKLLKPLKPISPSPPTRLPILIFSLISLLIGLAGTIFAVAAIRRAHPLTVFRCGKSDDTFRALYTANSRSVEHNTGLIERPKLLGVVGILTGFNGVDRRAAMRSTWFPSDPDGILKLEHATGLAFRFVIGRSKDSKKKKGELQKEIDQYRDFLVIDVKDEYVSLPWKTLEFFKAAFQHFEADYYVKADDDIYLRPDRLAILLAKERTDSQTYIGCMKKGPVITDPKMKWYEKSGHLIGNEYYMHAYGPIYVLSAEVVASLATARNNSLRMFNNEDVTIGSWMLAMNVQHEDNRFLCDPRCSPESIAVWDIPKCSGNFISVLKS